MAVVRRWAADMNRERLVAELQSRQKPTETEIDSQAAEDGDALTEEDLARAVLVHPPPIAESARPARLSQAQFARRFGFSIDTTQQYEQGRRAPSGPASVLLGVIDSDPGAVIRALDPRRAA